MNLLRRLILKLPEIELIQVEEGLYSPRLLDLELELSTIDGGMTPPPHQSIRERERERGAVSIDLVVEARQPIHQGGLGNLSWRLSLKLSPIYLIYATLYLHTLVRFAASSCRSRDGLALDSSTLDGSPAK